MIEFRGEQVEIMELSKRFNVPWSTINNRHKRGVTGDELVDKDSLRSIVHYGKKTTLTAISALTGIPPTTLKGRHADGLRNDELVKPEHRGKYSKNAANKLNETDVIEIKILLLTSVLKQYEIARMFNVDQSTVSDIKRGKRWPEIVVNLKDVLPTE